MSMLGKKDGDYSENNVSYLDIASFIKSYTINPNKDLEELWKRIVLNIAISNTDDHLKNHGFILNDKGWSLSPLYDINPNPTENELKLNINQTDNSLSIKLAIETAKYYNLSNNKAKEIANEIISIVKNNWKNIAIKHGISKSEIDDVSPAFYACNEPII